MRLRMFNTTGRRVVLGSVAYAVDTQTPAEVFDDVFEFIDVHSAGRNLRNKVFLAKYARVNRGAARRNPYCEGVCP